MRLNTFDALRGIAIVFIVAGHCYWPWSIDKYWERVLSDLITGQTVLFVFISGFFFNHIFHPNFNYKQFMLKKSKNVLLPYLVLSSLAFIYYLNSVTPLPYLNELPIKSATTWYEHLDLLGIYLWTGRLFPGYWYIPFIMIIFLMSPVFRYYIGLPAAMRFSIFILTLVGAMIFQRPLLNLSPIHSVLYYLPIYLLGILYSLHMERVNRLIKGKTLLLGLITLGLAILQVQYFNWQGNFHKAEIFSYNGIDIIIIQKIFLCFFFVALLQCYEDRPIPGLNLLAAASFAIYFLHPAMLELLGRINYYSHVRFLPEFGIFMLTTVTVISFSLLLAVVIKKCLGKYSRLVIGW